MEQKNLLKVLSEIICEQRENHQWGTAHVYQSTANSFSLYIKGVDISFSDMTSILLKDYEIYLRGERKCSWNTVATYMKVLKAVYNRAVDRGYATYVPRLFKHVCTSPCTERKKALEADAMKKMLGNDFSARHISTRHQSANSFHLAAEKPQTTNEQSLPAFLQTTRHFFALMFLLRGIPFVDLVYLRKSDIQGNVLTYRRRKTGKLLTVELTSEAIALIRHLSRKDKHSPYLFPFLSSAEGTEAAYREYQISLRRFNRQLKLLAEYQGDIARLSSYSARHTWATMAYYCEISPGIISEAMGHSSIAVTEVYLKPFRNDRIDRANRQVIAFVRA